MGASATIATTRRKEKPKRGRRRDIIAPPLTLETYMGCRPGSKRWRSNGRLPVPGKGLSSPAENVSRMLALRRNSGGLRETGARDFEENVLFAPNVWACARSEASDFFHGALRAHVLHPHAEHHGLNKSQSVLHQELFHLAVVSAAPTRASQKRPADLNFAVSLVVFVVARRADRLPCLGVEDEKRSARLQSAAKIFAENVLLVAVALRMLLPDQRVGRDAPQHVPILCAQGAQRNQFAAQRRLKLERHPGDCRTSQSHTRALQSGIAADKIRRRKGASTRSFR